MNRVQFWVLTVASLILLGLFTTDIVEGYNAQAAARRLSGMHILIGQGKTCYERWQQIAVRTYQLGQQDPALRDVLTRQQINVKPRVEQQPAQAAPPASGPASRQSGPSSGNSKR